jgi:hypothetical protein
MRNGQIGLNSQRIQREVSAINLADFESKTRRANNVEAVRRNEKHLRFGYLALVQH